MHSFVYRGYVVLLPADKLVHQEPVKYFLETEINPPHNPTYIYIFTNVRAFTQRERERKKERKKEEYHLSRMSSLPPSLAGVSTEYLPVD